MAIAEISTFGFHRSNRFHRFPQVDIVTSGVVHGRPHRHCLEPLDVRHQVEAWWSLAPSRAQCPRWSSPLHRKYRKPKTNPQQDVKTPMENENG
jgi:hypothetical protein